MLFLRIFLAILALATLACSGPGVAGPGARTDAPPIPPDLPHLEERAALLALVDRQEHEPVIVRRGLAGPPELRRETALAVGRMGDPGGLEALYALLLDEVPEVRREAAFALGELAELPGLPGAARTRAAARLLEAADDPDRETGRLAVEALGKAGVVVTQVAEALAGLPVAERRARLLPPLWRFPEEAAVPLAADGLAAEDPELRSRAAYALTREPRPAGLPHVRELAGDPDPRVRAWAARALGIAGEGADLALLRPLLDDPAPDPAAGPVVQALRAARSLVASGRAAPPPEWRPRLLELLGDPRPHVRVTALEAAGAWLLDEELGAALAGIVGDPSASAWDRGTALVALATGGDARAGTLAAELAAAPSGADPILRARAAEAAGILGARELLGSLADDPDPRVRQAVAAARLALADSAAAPSVAAAALEDPDAGVRAAVLTWLGDRPVVPLEELREALLRALRDLVVEERLAAVDALAARGEAAPEERDAVVALLEGLVEGRLGDDVARIGHLTRRRAADGLAALGRPRPATGPVATGRPAALYRTILLQTAEPRTVEVETPRGAFRLRLDCPRVPLTCLSFLQLARQGFYDGLSFHRVVPDFVVQGGDPRGDGWGGPGYTVRDEIHRLRFERGVVGMALAGPDTGGSQLFVTLAPQPHLDGGYTAFGEVTEGMEVLDRMAPGDVILRVWEVAGPER